MKLSKFVSAALVIGLAAIVVTPLTATASTSTGTSDVEATAPAEVVPPSPAGDAAQCQHDCESCKKLCWDQPLDKRPDCREACERPARACCESNGKKPPSFGSCSCN